MKHIQKGGAPRIFSEWRDRVRGTDKEDYRELPAVEKAALIDALLDEQGFICAYTMRRIEVATSHAEHLKPQSLCRQERTGSDLDYNNLVACFPREGMRSQYRYGAQQRGDWWNPALFVTPLESTCEQRFRFDLLGKVNTDESDAAARETCRRLALDHDSLVEDRKRVIDEFIYGAEGTRPLSETEARNFLTTVARRKRDGKFFEFCVAIRHALEDYLKNLEKNRRRRVFGRKSKS